METAPAATPPILEIDGLQTTFHTRDGVVRAVDGVSCRVHRGEVLAVVGESGCGKSVTALSVLRLIPSPPAASRPTRFVWTGWTFSSSRRSRCRAFEATRSP